MDDSEIKRQKNPREGASLLSIFSFAWLFKTFITGFRRELNLSDLYYPLDEHSSHNVGDQIFNEWKREQERCNNLSENTYPNLIKVIAKCFGKDIAIGALVQTILEFFIRLSRPYILLQLLHYSHERSDMTMMKAYCWAAVLVVGVFVDCIVSHICVQNLMHTGMKIRVACSSLIYRKILSAQITFTANETSVGQVLNLLSNDVSRIDRAVYYMNYIWIAPLQALLVFYFLYREVDSPASLGIFLQLLFIPILGFFGRLTNYLTNKYTVRTDERLILTNEIVKGIRAIKMYAWEKPFSALVAQVRKKEVQIIKKDSIMSDMSLASEFYIPRLCIFITVLAYVLLGNKVNVEKVYVVTAFYDVLRMSMYTLFPMCMHDIAEALVSIKRLEKFMQIEDKLKGISSNGTNGESDEAKDEQQQLIAVRLKNVSAQWTGRKMVLENVSLAVKRKSLIGIVGQVGSGKTSLLRVILGELGHAKGEVRVEGRVSYASQDPWIFSSSVRQNILLGRPMVESRYEEVIEVCQLRRDLETFARGDATLVGEKGINLSGGQCARLNLARAIYREADVYLLDDPLSAVDLLVAAKIFHRCLKSYLKEKTVILVTHQLHFLRQVDRIIVLNDAGMIKAAGTFDELQQSGELAAAATAGFLRTNSRVAAADVVESVSSPPLPICCSSSSQQTLPTLPALQPETAPSHYSSSSSSSSSTAAVDDESESGEKPMGGSISAQTYVSYFLTSNSVTLIVFVVLSSFLHQLACSGGDFFLAHWVNVEEQRDVRSNDTCSIGQTCLYSQSYVYVYAGITVATVALCFLQSWTFFEMSMRIANNLHANMFTSVICAPIDFFRTNSLGRIMNRFSKDMSIIDVEVSRAMIDVIQNAIHLIAAFILVSSINFWLLIPAIFVGFCFYLFSLFFIKTSRSIKRLEAITRSPVLSHVSDTLEGLTTIRALEAEEILNNEFDDHLDLHSSACYIFFSGSRGLGMYLDLFCAFYLTCVVLILLSFDGTTRTGDLGLAITQCMLLINMLQWGVRQFAELENQMTSVERVLEYSKLPKEFDDLDTFNEEQLHRVREINEITSLVNNIADYRDTEIWPNNGQIEFRNVRLRYSSEGPIILNNLNFQIKPREKVGIVGRTGAGKSSLINALFRLSHVEGEIFVDEISTDTIHLRKLRSKISIIPQEPILFTGNLRSNLDPFGEYTDSELWQSLEDVGVKRGLDMNLGLEAKVNEGGSNFSVGQRQLLCLARAILRKNKILVLDEATANVDPCTDELIQKTVKKKFENCTILTIAHRLRTVIDSDRIMVMDSGKIVEFDHPFVLLTEKKGWLYNIIQKSGSGVTQQFTEISKLNYEKKMKNETIV